jgi:hypothetical protein
LVQYINPKPIIWLSRKNIETAFNHILEYTSELRSHAAPPLPSKFFTVGLKTPFDVLSYDSCMLYKICKYHNIKTLRTTSLGELANITKWLLSPYSVITKNLSSMNRDDLISSLLNAGILPELIVEAETKQSISSDIRGTLSHIQEIEQKSALSVSSSKNRKLTKYDAKELIRINRTFGISKELMRRVVPESNEEAIILAYKNYSIDISESSYPQNEYKELRECSKKRTNTEFKKLIDITNESKSSPEILPVRSSPEILPVRSSPEILPVRSSLEILPVRSSPEILPVKSSPEILPVKSSPEILPVKSSPEILPVKSLGEQSYIPVDVDFRNRYFKSRWWYNTKITWKPLFSHLYSQNCLIDFALAEGFTQSEIDSSTPEGLLHLSRVTDNFYSGTHFSSINDRSVIDRDTISELKDSELICYGTIDDGKLVTFKINELNTFFLNYRSFLNPYDLKEVFSPRCVRKLKLLTKNFPISRTILTLQQTCSQQFEKLSRIYKSADTSTQNGIVTALRNLLEMAFYMRGWKVSTTKSTDDFPLSKESTLFPLDRQDEVVTNVTAAIVKYECFLNTLPHNVVDEIKSLPLLGFAKRKDDGLIEFVSQTNYDQGLTITERINIVKAGTSPYSCIRLSSNFLALSAYYYLHLITGSEPFDIYSFGYNVT